MTYRSTLVGVAKVLPTEADPNAPPPLSADEIAKAFRSITPTLVVVGVATGAAFAIGSVLVSKYVFPPRRRRR